MTDTPHLDEASFRAPEPDQLFPREQSGHPARILLLYGSLREVAYSRLMVEEAARVLERLGCETRIFNPSGLPLPDDAPADHPKVVELREMVMWCEGMVWSSPERHGAMTGILKNQVDWIPLSPIGGVRPTQGKTLALMQVSGGSQSFNSVNQMRILGRWMRLLTIPNQSSVARASNEFENGRMKPSPFYNRMVDVMEELVRFTLLTRDIKDHLVDRYSERVETREELSARVNLKDAT
ncbi:arsenical resistance protein ArsH [Oceanicola sp. 502str15]|uniref:arsenical resistance protein ArsH n=1 Tax=Oceanicola sp. 502str15 TaxID=2696061 RepID=UPI002095AF72|nr:arsenical resistance protein ArsH [Oceanicola sp. 502str15]MCO6383685.1 arsenical resistance protein ArsH [Oceanicola sp. 502str15]